MDAPQYSRDAVLASFCEHYWEDVEQGGPRPLESYLRKFSGHDAAIAAEFLELEKLRTSVAEEPEATRTDLESGTTTLGSYRLIRVLGHGGQGSVWLAQDERLGRQVALKLLRMTGPGSDERLRRFRREAAVASSLDHPGICTIHEAGIENGTPYIAMRYVEGQSLADRIRSQQDGTVMEETGRPSEPPAGGAESPSGVGHVDEVLALFEGAARAVHAAHEAGVVHRDLKPANLMITPAGDPVILDFGLAYVSDDAGMTRTGEVFGTPAYMSPEQVAGHRLERRTDVYSLGASLYEAVSLRRPFDAPGREALYRRILTEPPPRLPGDAPQGLDLVVATAMAKKPEQRYPTALELAEELGRVRRREPIVAVPPPWSTKLVLWARRNPAVATSLVGAFACLVVGLAASLMFLGRARQRTDELVAERRVTRRLLDEYEQMSDASLVRRLLAEEPTLWPRRAATTPAMEAWLASARSVLERRSAHGQTLQRLRALGPEYTDLLRETDTSARREFHPRFFAEHDAAAKAVEAARAKIAGLEADRHRISRRRRSSARPRRQLERREEQLTRQIEDRRSELGQLEDALALLRRDSRYTQRLTLGSDDERLEWRHEVLVRLLNELGALSRLRSRVAERLAEAQHMRVRTVDAPRTLWDACLADLRTNPRYGQSPELQDLGFAARFATLEPQVGLIPLGRDARTGLWEFWVPETGPRPPWTSRGSTGGSVAIPTATEDLDFGMVLVLLPGGRFTMGADSAHGASTVEGPAHPVVLAPFFMSKFEITTGQWFRVFDRYPGRLKPGMRSGPSTKATPKDPATEISRTELELLARRLALNVPTEAQWEYAARGGSPHPWWTGPAPAQVFTAKAGNLRDRSYGIEHGQRGNTKHDDGYALTAPVGSFAPNPFGLHDVIGNVWEWVREPVASYTQAPLGDDALRMGSAGVIGMRGGSYTSGPKAARATNRRGNAPDFLSPDLGARLSRSLSR